MAPLSPSRSLGGTFVLTLTWAAFASLTEKAVADSHHMAVFRVGSGAAGSDMIGTSFNQSPRPTDSHYEPNTKTTATPSWTKTKVILCALDWMPVMTMFIIGCMMPHRDGGGGGGLPRLQARSDFTTKLPPVWSPENERSYSFRRFLTDLALWVMVTDLPPYSQAPAIVMRLEGSASEMARMFAPEELAMGGVRNGVNVDPVTLVVGALQDRYGALEEESRLQAMTELLAFQRNHGESINSLLTRYDTVRARAAIEGQFLMNIEGCALQLLRAIGTQPQHLMVLLQPFGGQLPHDEAQFDAMTTQLRRFGHITENYPGNIASSLHGPLRQARPGAYWSLADDNPTAEYYFTGNNADTSQSGNNPADPWSHMGAQGFGSPPPDHTVPSGGHWAEPGYYFDQNTNSDQTTDRPDTDEESSSATSSDDLSEELHEPELEGMDDHQAAEHIFFKFKRYRKMWRRFTGRPVRKFRRVLKHHKRRRHKGKGKGKHFGKGSSRGGSFMWTQSDSIALLSGKGKGHRSHTSGKGFGRKGNPKGKDGQPLKCHKCGSTDHFERNCPKGGGKGSMTPSLLIQGGASSSSQQGAPIYLNHSTSDGHAHPPALPPPGLAPLAPWSDTYEDLFTDQHGHAHAHFTDAPDDDTVTCTLGFPSFTTSEGTSETDPLNTSDPWAGSTFPQYVPPPSNRQCLAMVRSRCSSRIRVLTGLTTHTHFNTTQLNASTHSSIVKSGRTACATSTATTHSTTRTVDSTNAALTDSPRTV